MLGYRTDAAENDIRETCGVLVSIHAACGKYVSCPGGEKRCGDSPIAREHGRADGFRCAAHAKPTDCHFVRVRADGTVLGALGT